MFSAWHLWVIVALILLIAEVFVPGFLAASFAIGCFFSAIVAAAGFGLKGQILGFIAGTLVAFFGVRPFFTKYCYKASGGIKTNVDALSGTTGRVTEAIDPASGSGRVRLGGDDWKAVSVEDQAIEAGALVEVVRIEGVKLFVKPSRTSTGA